MKANDMTANSPCAEKRANRRFSFFADAEIIRRDGTSVPTQLAELSSRGCYMGALVPIPIGTELRLRISDGTSACELHGEVIYLHSGDGLGIFGMGVMLGKMAAEERSVIDGWLDDLSTKRAAAPCDSTQQR